jgi:cellobiose epimerase
MISSHSEFREDLYRELTQNILPFWTERMSDHQYGGFHGQVNGMNQIVPKAEKGGILNARILWTFSAAGRLLNEEKYLQAAKRACDYIFRHFFDKEFGGTYWLLDYSGSPADTKKQIYSQAFFIYALAEYHMATGDEESLAKAIELFRLIEEKSFDPVSNGYFEAYNRQWQLLDDLRLSPKDANEKKTMNTHLHILEAYTNLFRIWKDPLLAKQLGNLIEIFLERIIDPDSQHLTLFFDERWNPKSSMISFGHDIESSWLLYEAALVMGDQNLIEQARQKCLRIVLAAEKGLQRDGSLIYETDPDTGHLDEDRHWWVQAEAVVGFFNAFELSRNKRYLYLSKKSFLYIKNHLIDPEGEWHWSIKSDGSINREDDKAGFWKCPYHNSRMCMEMISRLSKVH